MVVTWVLACCLVALSGIGTWRIVTGRLRVEPAAERVRMPGVAGGSEVAAATLGPASGGSPWTERHLAWLEARESSRMLHCTEVLGQVHTAVADLERCAELAGAQPELQAILDGALDRLRDAARSLRTEVSPLGAVALDGSDLKRGLQSLAAVAQDAADIAVDVRVEDSVQGHLSPPDGVHVLTVVREALSNAVRHARASRVALRAAVENSRLVVSIADDGVGFDPELPRPAAQSGFRQMFFRAEAARSLLQVESARGAGTIVTLTVPLPKQPDPTR